MSKKLMLIGIDGSRAFIKNRTGIEEYSYQVIKNLTNELSGRVVLYVRENQIIDFDLPKNWEIRIIKWKRFWTQIGLSLEILMHPIDVLFVPAHTVPVIHPKKTFVVIHGLEYEFCPKAYSFWGAIYMRTSIKKSCHWAIQIISVSKNTKKDLMNLYEVPGNKIKVVYEGYKSNQSSFIGHQNTSVLSKEDDRLSIDDEKYFLFIGRIEERKNISNIVKAFKILKEKYKIPHKLVLAGKPGHNYDKIKLQIENSKNKDDILSLGFIDETEKWNLLRGADVFVFPTLYEGFGIPILEAQSVGCPVVASSNSSIPEVVGESGLLADPQNPNSIAESAYEIISNETLKNAIIEKGLENVKKFSWEKCAREISLLIMK